MITTENTALLYASIAILTVVWAIMAVYVFSEIKKTYARNGTFTSQLLNSWFAM